MVKEGLSEEVTTMRRERSHEKNTLAKARSCSKPGHLTCRSRASLGEKEAEARSHRALWGIITGLGSIPPAMESLWRIVRKGEMSCMLSDHSGCHLELELGEVETLVSRLLE